MQNNLNPQFINTSHNFTQDSYFNEQLQISHNFIRKQKQYLVKIPLNQYETEDKTYIWRLEEHENILGITEYKIINKSNSGIIAKITVQPFVCNFSQIELFSLTQGLQYIKQAINGLKTLINTFQIQSIKSNNLFRCQKDEIKLWPLSNFQLNPTPVIPSLSAQHSSEKNICKDLIEVIKQKCLKTKLSSQFFKGSIQCQTFQELHTIVLKFQNKHNLNSLILSKETVSTNFSESLKFSNNSIHKKRVKSIQKIKSQPYIRTKCLDIQSELQKMEINSYSMRKSKNSIDKSLTTQLSGQGISKTLKLSLKPIKCDNKDLFNKESSLVISHIYNDSLEQKNQGVQSRKSFGVGVEHSKSQNRCFSSQKQNAMQIPYIHRQMRLSNENLVSQEEEKVNPFEIIIKNNGWSTDIKSLMQVSQMKQSMNIGKQENNLYQQLSLKKLNKLGRQAIQSFIPVEQQESALQC